MRSNGIVYYLQQNNDVPSLMGANSQNTISFYHAKLDGADEE